MDLRGATQAIAAGLSGVLGAGAVDLARAGVDVAFLDRAGRIKPCGGAIPPRLIEDFSIPDNQIVAHIQTARMISPTQRAVDIPIEGGFVGIGDREHFDKFLRLRAVSGGATRLTGTYLRLERDGTGTHVVYRDKASGDEIRLATRLVIGADGARFNVARSNGARSNGARSNGARFNGARFNVARFNVARTEVPGGASIPYVIAYHETIKAPKASNAYNPGRCDVICDGKISPDFYGWVFPHGEHASVGMATGIGGIDLKQATADLRAASGLAGGETIWREGAPIPLRPLVRWDNGHDVVLAGDAAGVVAPSSGEGIYYAMVGGRVAATAAQACLASGRASKLRRARKMFIKEHGTVFKVLRSMQDAYCK